MIAHGAWLGGDAAAADVHLFCFPHAGGGSTFFRPWQKALLPGVAVMPVVLPGRETRWREPAFTRMDALVDAVCDAIAAHLDRPFALFGHSMGAAVASEVARRLTVSGHMPLCLFVSARRPPHLPARQPPIHHLPDDAFLAAIERLGGTADAVLAEPSLLHALLPGLRADFEVNETWKPARVEPLAIPISALAADGDRLVTVDEVRRWGDLTADEFSLRVFDGDHFYLSGGRADLLDAIRYDIARASKRARERACTTS